jgi:hypothetical protein
LRGRRVQVQRSSSTLGEQILATAVPVIHNGATVGAVRVTQSVAAGNWQFSVEPGWRLGAIVRRSARCRLIAGRIAARSFERSPPGRRRDRRSRPDRGAVASSARSAVVHRDDRSGRTPAGLLARSRLTPGSAARCEGVCACGSRSPCTVSRWRASSTRVSPRPDGSRRSSTSRSS